MTVFIKLLRMFAFLGFFAREVLVSNLRLIVDILGPRERLHPGLVDIPLDLDSDRQRWILATCITMTPGTLSLDLSDDGSVLHLHTLHAENPAALVADIKERFETRVRHAF